MIRQLAVMFAVVWPALVQAQDCRSVTYLGNAYAICTVDMTTADVRLFLNDDDGAVLGQFSSVDGLLAQEGNRLAFGMNAGMYHSDRSPVGLFVDRGTEIMRLVPGAGPGNFGLVPNGVFCIREGRADVFETSAFQDSSPDCTYATQSGPMLVIDGALHPRFLVDGTSRYIRNGVGTTADGTQAVFVISNNPVNFYEFGTLFRDGLGLPNALYFDGKVSRLFAPSLGRNDLGFSLGPIVGVVEPVQ